MFDTAVSQSGGWLTNRAIRFFGQIVAIVVNQKMTWPGGLTVEFLGVYGVFIAGDASLAGVEQEGGICGGEVTRYNC